MLTYIGLVSDQDRQCEEAQTDRRLRVVVQVPAAEVGEARVDDDQHLNGRIYPDNDPDSEEILRLDRLFQSDRPLKTTYPPY